MESQDIDFIVEGLNWLSKNIKFRDGKDKETQQDAAIYTNRQLRVVRRILDYVANQDDATVILLRKLLELELHPDIKDLSMTAIMGKRTVTSFSNYENSLIFKIIFGKGSRWSNLQ